MSRITLPRPVVSLIVDRLAGFTASGDDAQRQARSRLLGRQRDIADRQARLLQAFLAGAITEEELTAERNRLQVQAEQVAAALAEQVDTSKSLELLKTKILSLNDAAERFETADDTKKSAIAGAFLSNLVTQDRNVAPILREPFRTVADFASNSFEIAPRGIEPRFSG